MMVTVSDSASRSSGRPEVKEVWDDRVIRAQALVSQPVRVRSGETPGSPIARLPASVERPPSKRSDEVLFGRASDWPVRDVK
jgi:hypothetical protein